MTILKDSKADVLNTRLNMVNQPIILPKLTTAERDALVGIVDGMMIENLTTAMVEIRRASAWVGIG